MADDHARDELAQLRAELAAQRAVTDALRARMDRPRRRHLPRRFLPLALVALLLILTPLALLAAAPFNDLTGGVHDANIGLIYDAGITKGCVPNVSYCPTGNVTREEMASFLARTAGLGTNPPVVNAKTAQTATTAGNANTVGGLAPNGLVRVARNATAGSVALPATASLGPLVSVTMTTPAPGFVLVTGAVTGRATAGGTVLQARLFDNTAQTFSTVLVATPDTTNNAIPLSPTYVFVVDTAGARTFSLQGALFSGAGSFANATITALYVPFGSTGVGTLGADEPGVGGGTGRDVPAR